jgi:predicted DsbA family dithiol-disulfide isomerase
MNKPTLEIVHYSDVLCVWAYIAQIRVDELQQNFPDEVRIDYRFLQVFGDVAGKMATQWSDRGGLSAYAAHVQEVAASFEHIEINPDAWKAKTPRSSLPAHLLLCGIKTMQADDRLVERVLAAVRHAFFVDLIDISDQNALLEIAEQTGVNMTALQQSLHSGVAHAQFSADLASATQSAVRSSPTMSFNEGRQILAGNVGYRVLEANIRELLRSPGDHQSWC